MFNFVLKTTCILMSTYSIVKRTFGDRGFIVRLHFKKIGVFVFSYFPQACTFTHQHLPFHRIPSGGGLYCFQGNLQSWGERIGWGVGKPRQNAGKQARQEDGSLLVLEFQCWCDSVMEHVLTNTGWIIFEFSIYILCIMYFIYISPKEGYWWLWFSFGITS